MGNPSRLLGWRPSSNQGCISNKNPKFGSPNVKMELFPSEKQNCLKAAALSSSGWCGSSSNTGLTGIGTFTGRGGRPHPRELGRPAAVPGAGRAGVLTRGAAGRPSLQAPAHLRGTPRPPEGGGAGTAQKPAGKACLGAAGPWACRIRKPGRLTAGAEVGTVSLPKSLDSWFTPGGDTRGWQLDTVTQQPREGNLGSQVSSASRQTLPPAWHP